MSSAAFSQTLGGAAAYNFLKLPSSPLLGAAGGVNISHDAEDVSLAANNPALLRPLLHSQVNASFNAFSGGISNYAVTTAFQPDKKNITIGAHIHYVNYGVLTSTDAAGNANGEFRPRDFVVQASAAKKYLERWTYGIAVKFINSSYQQYSSAAIAADFGLLYSDSSNRFTASILARNMGTQLKTYTGEGEDLPFDLQAGISHRLAKAPFGFSLTAHHLHRADLTYADAAFNGDNGFSPPSGFDKVFNHFVLATHIYPGPNLEATIAYNHLRRQELSVPTGSNGLTGFSAGLLVKFSKLHIFFARSSYQRGVSTNQIGITAQLNKMFGLGL